jgi:hypothetical protein
VVVVWGGLAAVGDDGERRRYHGTVDGVGGEALTRKINGSPFAVAKIDGAEVGRGGGFIIVMVGGSGIGAEGLASPKREVLCRASICFLLTGNYS